MADSKLILLENDYEKHKNDIDKLINNIKEKVKKSNPLELLNYLFERNIVNFINLTSEIESSLEEIYSQRAIEYIQSILVSQENSYMDGGQESEFDDYEDILMDVINLYYSLNDYYFYWTEKKLKDDPSVNRENLAYIIESEFSRVVRGDRYQCYQIEHFREILSPHNQIFEETFKLNVENFIKGLENLEYILTQGRLDEMKKMADGLNEFFSQEIQVDNVTDINQKFKELLSLSEEIQKLDIIKLHGIKEITGWSDEFIDILSYGINEYRAFFNDETYYSGWPNLDLPIQKRPFIKINNIAYGFDYYSIFDNLYRAIQKNLIIACPSYKETWAIIQQETTEKMVENLFKKILPGCNTFRDNYYPRKKSLKDCAENDLLITFNDVMLIVEVKAGSFIYTSALTDYKGHINSFKALIEKADHQCDRTKEYIEKNTLSKIYTKEKDLKVELDMRNYSEIYCLCVTVDNFNTFTAKAEKINFIKLKSNSISLSIDDLRIYRDIFDNPLQFLHYLKERRNAIECESLALNDELDHLGMYLERNLYTWDAKEVESGTRLSGIGYRQELDNYFSLLHHNIEVNKPTQNMAPQFKEILDLLSKIGSVEKIGFSNFLLDFDFESRDNFVNQLESILLRQKQIGYMIQTFAPGEMPYAIFVYAPDLKTLTDNDKANYIYANLNIIGNGECLVYDFYYDRQDRLRDIKICSLKLSNLQDLDQIQDVEKVVEFISKQRIEKYREVNGKIGRNDNCPCGRNKKYKKCCEIKKY
ncbi:SEC-C metal-binding domain-containing protein [Lysinibacillus sp. KU-BSD001]|uniref:SEC-C metal-binding domain-containing protein n=1 Tax=Lysinibacillus sp. KU-BSD001 TaxID=3141328 RepID=UPI0036DFB97B